MANLDKSGGDESTEQRLRGYLQYAFAKTMPKATPVLPARAADARGRSRRRRQRTGARSSEKVRLPGCAKHDQLERAPRWVGVQCVPEVTGRIRLGAGFMTRAQAEASAVVDGFTRRYFVFRTRLD